MTAPGTAAAVIGEAVNRFGGLDVLINNAGALSKRVPTEQASDDYIAEIVALNATQVACFVRKGAIQMRRQGGGTIINVSSIAGRNGGGPGSVIYAAAKGFFRCRQAQLGAGVRGRSDARQRRSRRSSTNVARPHGGSKRRALRSRWHGSGVRTIASGFSCISPRSN